MNIYLESERLFLREFTPDENHLMLDLDSDPDVMKYLTDSKPSTAEEIQAAMNRVQVLYKKFSSRFGTWPAFEKSTKDFIGWFLLRPCWKDPDNIKVLELGYRFKKIYWGKGYATEMSKHLIKKAFTELEANAVFATAMKKHHGSYHVMEKVGMKYHSDYQEDEFPGVDKLAVKYWLDKKDWQKLQR